MPKRDEPEIISLQRALDNNPLISLKTAKAILEDYPELMKKYGATDKEKRAFQSYWNRMRKTVRETVLRQQKDQDNEFAEKSSDEKSSKKSSKKSSDELPSVAENIIPEEYRQAPPPSTPEKSEDVQEDEAIDEIIHKFRGATIAQLSNGEHICLPYQGAVWKDEFLNEHLAINIHLLSGATKDNTVLEVSEDGWKLVLTTEIIDLLTDAYIFTQFPQLRKGKFGPDHPMVLAFQEESRKRHKTLGKSQVLEATMEIGMPFQVDEKPFNDLGHPGEVMLVEGNKKVYHVQLVKRDRVNYGISSPEANESSFKPDRSRKSTRFYASRAWGDAMDES